MSMTDNRVESGVDSMSMTDNRVESGVDSMSMTDNGVDSGVDSMSMTDNGVGLISLFTYAGRVLKADWVLTSK